MTTISQSLLTAFIGFAAVMCFTPGPNNVMLLSSGVTYGFRRTVPHIGGITVGFALMIAAVGLGFGTVFIAYPVLQAVLKYLGAAYLVYLAIAIALSGPPNTGENRRGGPMTFWGAAVFPVGERQGLGDGHWHHHGLCGDRGLSLEHPDPDCHHLRDGRGIDGHVGAVRKRAAAGPDL
jgi:LysE type translocator